MAVGLVLALAGAPLLTRFLDGLPPRDLPSYLLSATLLLSVTVVAAWLPSRKAARSTIVAALAEE
jgi:ABC-type antimicrobial peptide transport system permease subunit